MEITDFGSNLQLMKSIQNFCPLKSTGVPFNIASYALLTHMFAQQLDLLPGDFVWTGGDVHLYTNHLEQARLQLTREPYALPQLNIIRKPDSIFDYKLEDFQIANYQSHPSIKAPIAV
jgi:thymidylate synthase